MSPNEWIPIRWFSGPLDIATRKNVTSDEKEALMACHRPESLRLLEGSPFNCLVVSFAAGKTEDTDQKRTLTPLIDAAKSKGLSVLGRVTGSPDGHIDPAREAGLDGLITDDPVRVSSLPVYALRDPASTVGNDPVRPLKECEWPSVRTGRSGNTEAGPTGYPWVDANGWRIQLARTLHPSATIWSLAEPKRTGMPVRPDQYALAVADSAAYGARWVASLDPLTLADLLIGTGEARQAWSTLSRTVRFFEEHKNLQEGQLLARLGVFSDFEGPAGFMAQEFLNLSARRQLPARILHPAHMPAEAWQGLKALVIIGDKHPGMEPLLKFVTGGGTIIVPPGELAKIAASHPSAGTHETGYQLYTAGKGLIAVSPEEWTDPYQVAQDAHRLLGRKNDVLRLWNAGSSIASPMAGAAAGANKGVVHVLNYTGRPVDSLMSLYVARPWTTARMLDLSGKPEPLKPVRKGEGTEVGLPVFTSWAAFEFGEKS